MKRACCIRATRSCPTARAAGRRCPAHEVAQGYKDVKERSATVRFKVHRRAEDTYYPGVDDHALDAA